MSSVSLTLLQTKWTSLRFLTYSQHTWRDSKDIAVRLVTTTRTEPSFPDGPGCGSGQAPAGSASAATEPEHNAQIQRPPFLPRKGKGVLKLKSKNKALCFETGGVNKQRHKAWGKLSFVRTQQKNFFFFGGRIFLKNIGMGFSTCCAGNYYLQACYQ